MAAARTIVTVSWSLQRTRHGEQAPWMGLTLAAMLGQIGLPGGGFGHGYGSMNEPGLPPLRCRLPALPQGPNPVQTFIPVAAISDMLLHPGEPFDYNGRRLTYPDIKLVYWAGGNPFHHHQNLPRLRRALGRVDTVVVHDPYWTAMAKHADIVVPSTTSFERDDYSGSRNDPLLMAMPALTEPYAESRDDYTTFAALAEALGFGEQFTEGRTARQWLAHLYDKWAAGLDFAVPTFDEFWRRGPTAAADRGRADAARPTSAPTRSPTGWARRAGASRSSPTTSTGSATTTAPATRRGSSRPNGCGGARAADYPLHLIANQPATRLHSQLDGGADQPGLESARARADPDASRRRGERGLADGDVVRVFNDRGACLAGVVVDDRCAPTSCNCRPAPGSTRPTRPTRMRCACTATPTCSPPTSARRRWPRAAPARMCWSRWRSSTVRCRR